MKVVLQAVSRTSVSVDGEVISTIGEGFPLSLGVADSDTMQVTDKMMDKIRKLRTFHGENGKTDLSLADADGKLLVISQFTLYADRKKGNRPNFIRAGEPDKAGQLYEHMTERCRMYMPKVEYGIFGVDMKVGLMNGGPFTSTLNSEELGFQ